jgi:uncharacterized membrane protein YesL
VRGGIEVGNLREVEWGRRFGLNSTTCTGEVGTFCTLFDAVLVVTTAIVLFEFKVKFDFEVLKSMDPAMILEFDRGSA